MPIYKGIVSFYQYCISTYNYFLTGYNSKPAPITTFLFLKCPLFKANRSLFKIITHAKEMFKM